MKPCELTCPKCGSADCNRKFRGVDQRFDTVNHDGIDNEFIVQTMVHTKSCFGGEFTLYVTRVKQDCIDHSCRICQYQWYTETLLSQNDETSEHVTDHEQPSEFNTLAEETKWTPNDEELVKFRFLQMLIGEGE